MRRTKVCSVVALLVIAAGAFLYRSHFVSGTNRQLRSSVSSVSNLAELLSIPPESSPKLDIARMNLLCAGGLPGAEDLDLNRSLEVLDEMAARVKSETDRHFYRFKSNPAEFENSEGYFRMMLLGVVLAEDFGVQYTPGKRQRAAQAFAGDGFFADARDVFLCGLTGPTRSGTCSSLPVLQVAVGRRLGYPLKLVTTKGHLFVRWEDEHEPDSLKDRRNLPAPRARTLH